MKTSTVYVFILRRIVCVSQKNINISPALYRASKQFIAFKKLAQQKVVYTINPNNLVFEFKLAISVIQYIRFTIKNMDVQQQPLMHLHSTVSSLIIKNGLDKDLSTFK